MSVWIVQGANSVARSFNNGNTWSTVNTFPAGISTVTLNDIAYVGNNNWVVCGTYNGNSDGFAMWSDDNGATWAKANLALATQPNWIANGTSNGQVTMYDISFTGIVYSSDYGKNWTSATNAYPFPIYSGIYHSGMFFEGNGVSLGVGYKFYSIQYYPEVGYSNNPVTTDYVQVNNTWDNTAGTVYVYGFYGNGVYVLVQDAANNIAYTTNAAGTWTKKAVTYSANGMGVYGNGYYVILSNTMSQVAYTTNVANTWSTHSTGIPGGAQAGGAQMSRMRYDDSSGTYMASDANTSHHNLYISTDIITWSTVTLTTNAAFSWYKGKFDVNPDAGIPQFFTHSII